MKKDGLFKIKVCLLNHGKFDRIQQGRKKLKKAFPLKQNLCETQEI